MSNKKNNMEICRALSNRGAALKRTAALMTEAAKICGDYSEKGILPFFEDGSANFVQDEDLHEWLLTAKRDADWTRRRAEIYETFPDAYDGDDPSSFLSDADLESLRAEKAAQLQALKAADDALAKAEELGVFGDKGDESDERVALGATLTEIEIFIKILDGKTGTTYYERGESEIGDAGEDDGV